MLEKFETWVAETLKAATPHRHSCLTLSPGLKGYFPESFLAKTYYLPVTGLPMPELGGVTGMLAKKLMPNDLVSIAYQDTFFVLREYAEQTSLHCRELVHLAQWQALGNKGFIKLLTDEVTDKGYRGSSLVQMADLVQSHFEKDSPLDNVPNLVTQSLSS